MPDYPSLAVTVTRLITDFGSGGQAVVERRVPGAYDPVLDEDAGETIDTFFVNVVTLGTGTDDQTVRLDDNAVTDRAKVYVSGVVGYVPDIGDLMSLPGRSGRYIIQDIKKTSPDGGLTTGGDALLYQCIVDRRGDI